MGRASRDVVSLVARSDTDEQRAAVIAGYQPVRLTPEQWAAVGPFVREYAARLDLEIDVLRRMLRVLARLAAWAHDHGVPLDVDVVLDPANVDRFVGWATGMAAPGTVATWRSDLRRIGPALTKTAPWERPLPPTRPILPARPYIHDEVEAILAAVEVQRTARLSAAARVAVLLGLGVGLDGRWAARIRGTDVHIDGTTVRIAVPAPAPRRIVVRDRFADRIVDLARTAGSGLLIGDQVGKNAISAALARVDVDQGRIKVEARRLRATWIAALLAAQVDLRAIIEAAGNVSAATVFAIATMLPPVDPADATRQVRSA